MSPVYLSPDHTLENLQTLCGTCNRHKGDGEAMREHTRGATHRRERADPEAAISASTSRVRLPRRLRPT